MSERGPEMVIFDSHRIHTLWARRVIRFPLSWPKIGFGKGGGGGRGGGLQAKPKEGFRV